MQSRQPRRTFDTSSSLAALVPLAEAYSRQPCVDRMALGPMLERRECCVRQPSQRATVQPDRLVFGEKREETHDCAARDAAVESREFIEAKWRASPGYPLHGGQESRMRIVFQVPVTPIGIDADCETAIFPSSYGHGKWHTSVSSVPVTVQDSLLSGNELVQRLLGREHHGRNSKAVGKLSSTKRPTCLLTAFRRRDIFLSCSRGFSQRSVFLVRVPQDAVLQQ